MAEIGENVQGRRGGSTGSQILALYHRGSREVRDTDSLRVGGDGYRYRSSVDSDIRSGVSEMGMRSAHG